MSQSIHVNLMMKSEMRSAAPVRLRVMLPLSAAFFAGGFAVLGVAVRTALVTMGSEELRLGYEQEWLTEPHKEVVALKAACANAKAGLKQLGFYRGARIVWGSALQALPDYIPETVQLTEIRHTYPPIPQALPFAPPPAATNRVETGSVVLSGRTTDGASVAAILRAFNGPPFDRLVAKAEVPPGSFRQESQRLGVEAVTLLFDVNVTCHPRRFE